MLLTNKDSIVSEINKLSQARIPFLWIINFELNQGYITALSELSNSDIYCSINGIEHSAKTTISQAEIANFYSQKTPSSIKLNIAPIALSTYKAGFDNVISNIQNGNTYLLNLTFPTPIGSNLSLESIYSAATSKYKGMVKDKFVFYSPEPFIKIENNKIYSFPMKGTIDANIPNAAQKLLNNKKELYEHYTIVDLIRNDLSIVSSNIQVESFRYIEKIETSHGPILQTSSKISGHLDSNWHQRLGDILASLLPAGSISGAPKEKTIEIIHESEIDSRGYYTGTMGIYDGQTIDSCVIIRYIEKSPKGEYLYRSGGGITSKSNLEEEYNELIEKIYVPTI